MVDTNSIEWQKFREQASIKSLTKDGVSIDLVRLEPNAEFDEHVHERAEWVFVLKGSFSDENGAYSEGHFIASEKGSKHSTKTGPDGCQVILIKLLD